MKLAATSDTASLLPAARRRTVTVVVGLTVTLLDALPAPFLSID